MSDMSEMFVDAMIQILEVTGISLIWWLITARKKENFFHWIGFKKPVLTCSIKKLLVIGILATSAYILSITGVMNALADHHHIASSQYAGQGFRALGQIFIYAYLATALWEEIFFRGFLCKRLSHQFGFAIGNTLQALLFGLMHGVPFGQASGSLFLGIILTLLPAGIGWFLGWMNEKCASGSIILSFLLHGTLNFLSALFQAF